MDIFEWEGKYAKKAYVYKVDAISSKAEADRIVKEFQEALRGEKIVIWGAGAVGKAFYLLLKELGIPVEGVADQKGGSIPFPDGIKVMPAGEEGMKEKLYDALVVAAVNRNRFEEIKKDALAAGAGCKKLVCGHEIHMVAQEALCMSKALDPGKKIIIKDCADCTVLDNSCVSLYRYLKRVNRFRDEGKGTKAVHMIGYALGNICTLKCRHCCESVPYMPQCSRQFVPGDHVMKDIRKLSGACNFLTLLEFIGGEPFLHPDLPVILNDVVKIRNIGMVHIFTNGTAVPDDRLCRALKNERITIYLSNYQAALNGQLLQKVAKTEQKLKDYGVHYLFGKKQSWLDFSQYDLVKSDGESKQGFGECFLHNCNRLQDGTLYVCPHQYAGIKLGKLNEAGETIKIHDYTDEELGRKLEEMKNWEVIDACRYCTMPNMAETVISGEQLTGTDG